MVERAPGAKGGRGRGPITGLLLRLPRDTRGSQGLLAPRDVVGHHSNQAPSPMFVALF